MRIGSDVQIIGTTDFNITGTGRRINFTAGSGTVRTTTSNSLILATNSTTALTLDSSQNATFAGTISSGAITSTGNINVSDNQQIQAGTGGDLFMTHNGTNSFIQNKVGGLYIEQATNDGNMIFRNDDGSGGLLLLHGT